MGDFPFLAASRAPLSPSPPLLPSSPPPPPPPRPPPACRPQPRQHPSFRACPSSRTRTTPSDGLSREASTSPLTPDVWCSAARSRTRGSSRRLLWHVQLVSRSW